MAKGPQTPVTLQLARARQLDELRLTRDLTRAEQDEADRLTDRAYMRAWRATQRDAELAINRRLHQSSGAAA